MRKKAKNEFEKDVFTLMNNSVFGKAMANVRNRGDIRLVTSVGKAEALNSKPNFKGATIFDRNLVTVHMGRTECKIDKPIYVGQAILHYKYVKPKWGERVFVHGHRLAHVRDRNAGLVRGRCRRHSVMVRHEQLPRGPRGCKSTDEQKSWA